MSSLGMTTAIRIFEEFVDRVTASRVVERVTLPKLRNSGMVNPTSRTPESSTRRRTMASYAEEQLQYHTSGMDISKPRVHQPPPIVFGDSWSQNDRTIITSMLQELHKTPAQKAESLVRALGIQVGDRVRLTEKVARDGSQLEGEVLGVKEKNGQLQLRIKGFGKTGGGAGGQYVWFVAADYKVEVLHQSYRWTTDDELVVQVAGLTRSSWEQKDEQSRQYYRDSYAKRVEKIKNILTPEGDNR
jgi:hypothetical protein